MPTYIEKLHYLNLDPTGISTRGNEPEHILSHPCVAVVGSRKPTPYGVETTERLVEALVRAGVVIISGLAFGIDSVAHRAALRAGSITVAVLPSGIDTIYPASHHQLANEIVVDGLLMSEFALSHKPRQHDFLHRNRLIAGLSNAVIIPEAAERSGSLNTARHALELNVPLFAVPGRLSDVMSQGTNQLVASGDAQALTTVRAVVDRIGTKPATHSTVKQLPLSLLDPLQLQVFEIIEQEALPLSYIQAATALPAPQLLAVLTNLELLDLVQQDSSGSWHTHTSVMSPK